MKLKGFIGPTYTTRTANYQAQRTINLFVEPDETGAAKEGEVAMLASVPGQDFLAYVPKFPIRGLHQTSNGYIVCVAGNSVYYLNTTDGLTFTNPTVIADLTTTTGPVSIADGIPNMYNGIVNTGLITQVVVVDGSEYGVVFEEGTTTAIQLNNGNSYVGADFVTFQDGFFIFTQIGRKPTAFFANDPLNISALDEVTANLGPDYISRIISDHDVLWFFGARSSTVWQNTGGGAGANIFQSIPGSYAEGGSAYPWTIAKCSGQLFWLTSDERGGGMVFQATGYRGMRISNFAVEQWIQSFSDLSGATAWTYQDKGHSFFCIYIPGSETTWCYDVLTKLWSERSWFRNGELHRDRIEHHIYLQDYGVHLCADYENPKLLGLNSESYTLDGEPIYHMRTAPHISNSFNRIYYSQVQMDLETGVGLGAGYVYNTQVYGQDSFCTYIANSPLRGNGPDFTLIGADGRPASNASNITIVGSGTWSQDWTEHGDGTLTVNPTTFPVALTRFGTGTGLLTNYTFTTGGLGASTTLTTANIYVEDWRGSYLQTHEPITNLCLSSENFNAANWLMKGIKTPLPAVWNQYPTQTIAKWRPTAWSTSHMTGSSSISNPTAAYDSISDSIKTSGTHAALVGSPLAYSIYAEYKNFGVGVNIECKLNLSITSSVPSSGGGGSIQMSYDNGVTWQPLWYFNTPSIFPPTLIGYGTELLCTVPIVTPTITIPDLSQFQVQISCVPGVGGTQTADVYDILLTGAGTYIDSPNKENAPDGSNTGTYIIEDGTYNQHGLMMNYSSTAGDEITVSTYYQIADSSRHLELALASAQISFQASIATNQLTVVTAPLTGVLAIGQTIEGVGLPPNCTIVSGSASPYTISWTAPTAIAAEDMTAYTYIARASFSPTGVVTTVAGTDAVCTPLGTKFTCDITTDKMTVTNQYSGKLAVGMEVSGEGIPPGTMITTGTESPYTISWTATTPLTGVMAEITSGGSPTGIYRCSVRGVELDTGTSHAGVLIYNPVATDHDAYLGNNASRIGVWGFQVQKGDLTRYVKSSSGIAGTEFITTDLSTGTVAFNQPPCSGAILTWDGEVTGISINAVLLTASFDYYQTLPITQTLGINPAITLSYSDDGGHSWSPERTTYLGEQGQYLRRCIWRRLGQSRDRVFRVVCCDPVKFNLIGAEFWATQGEANGK